MELISKKAIIIFMEILCGKKYKMKNERIKN